MKLNLHRHRLVSEKRTVDGLLEQLKTYSGTADLTNTESDLVRRQRIAMRECSYLLGLRLQQLPPISVDD